jgi:hypothetical protein
MSVMNLATLTRKKLMTRSVSLRPSIEVLKNLQIWLLTLLILPRIQRMRSSEEMCKMEICRWFDQQESIGEEIPEEDSMFEEE